MSADAQGHLNDLFDEPSQDEAEVTSPEEGTDQTDNPGTEESTDDVGSDTDGATETPGEETPSQEEEAPTEESEADPSGTQKPDADELTQLRALLRAQNQKLRELERQSQATQKDLQEKGLLEEPDEDEVRKASEASQLRASQLETVLEVMRLNPKYEDVDQIVTQSRFDDMVEGFAFAISQDKGGKAEDYVDAVAAKVWGMTNPYRYMYDKIKEFHPDFKEQEAPIKPAAPAKVEPKPKEAPPTISKLTAGDADTQSGWTSARIDAMPEEDLGKVPRDIYEKYLSGVLK